jgi:selenocysteine lyase/cysteine desulfurase
VSYFRDEDDEYSVSLPLVRVTGGDLSVPILGGQTRAINLDYAASAPALEAVTAHVTEFLPYYSSVHRGAGFASQVSTSVYENSRAIIGKFLGARAEDTVIFTRNTTDSLNLLARAVPGETVFLDIEHHANLLPWVAAGGRVVRSGDTLAETLTRVEAELARTPAALLSVTGASNVTGEVMPLATLAEIAHRHGARIAVDGAQLVPHRRVNMAALDIDYLALSGHKTYAPFGAGVLVGRGDWLDEAPPLLLGGGGVTEVHLDSVHFRTGPARHEAGSPNVVGVIALARAVETLGSLDENEWVAHERGLTEAAIAGLEAIDGVKVIRLFGDAPDVVGVVSFTVEGIDARLLATALSVEHGIAVRDGRFCAHPLMHRLGIDKPALRASFGVGSRTQDVDALLSAVRGIVDRGPKAAYDFFDGQWEPIPDTRVRPAWASDRVSGQSYSVQTNVVCSPFL